MKFGERLKQARINKKLTQEQVAEDFFITRQAISNWENEKTYPDMTMLIKLSDYYHLSLDTLLKEDTGMREYLEKKEVVKGVRPIRGSLTLIDLLLFGIFIYNIYKHTIPVGSITWYLLILAILIVSFTMTRLNKFDQKHSLQLEYTWQKYLTGEKGLTIAIVPPILCVIAGLILTLLKWKYSSTVISVSVGWTLGIIFIIIEKHFIKLRKRNDSKNF
ncbi:helix-turn-helix transcriptional regulator [Lactobacillus sp. ESL0791]|uniref:helix-turn-helix domain-containing protein n=1 Tax=Lactobacillus sp. ESL0791 TaxID=2983234 RepID=UPI0023F67B81|nr:helix-turn-helix transcriptional regulator [Lactobacillus sp. ESL0791]MDF7639876.1 helix-turn-helix transcriptional regulator [Lactobacillus sp. ESL0791]